MSERDLLERDLKLLAIRQEFLLQFSLCILKGKVPYMIVHHFTSQFLRRSLTSKTNHWCDRWCGILIQLSRY